MTILLKKALDAVEQLPENEQDIIASLILEELDDENKWSKSFDFSKDKLSKLASEARTEYRSGKTKPLDI